MNLKTIPLGLIGVVLAVAGAVTDGAWSTGGALTATDAAAALVPPFAPVTVTVAVQLPAA